MAKFLNTSATNYYLEEMIKNAKERLVLISPYLKFNSKIRELIEDKNRMKIDIRLVYGKTELQPEAINWLSELTFVRTSFCHNLHAKFYMNEESCIITSLNLYDFSQVNNNEMGIFLDKETDSEVFLDAYEEAQRIIRVSDEVVVSAKKVEKTQEAKAGDTTTKVKGRETSAKKEYNSLTTAKLAQKHGVKTAEINTRLLAAGYLKEEGEHLNLSEGGKAAGAVLRKGKNNFYILWPKDILG